MALTWQPLGLIFDPTEHDLPMGCIDFAQAPQALVLADRIRVFFSMRRKDTPTTYLSHIGSADFSLDWSSILNVSKEGIIPLGQTGTFDEHGIFPLNVFQHSGEIYGFTTGWSRRVSVPSESAIGLGISKDNGKTFERVGPGPILSATLNEPFLIADGCGLSHDGLVHMWYLFGQRWKLGSESKQPERVYKIGHATSTDLLTWSRTGTAIIPDRIDSDECQALPTVFSADGRFHMIFCYRPYEGFRTGGEKGYRLGYASSRDLIQWSRDDIAGGIDFPNSEWDSKMRCYPNVVNVQGQYFLLYNGNDFGRRGFGLARLDM